MKKSLLFLLPLSMSAMFTANAQNVGIGTTNPMQKLHIAGGLRVDTLANGKDSGLLRHDPNGTVFSLLFPGDSTQVLRGDGTFGFALSDKKSPHHAWLLEGNSNVDPAVNFLGTLNNVAVHLRINDQWAGLLDSVSQSTYFGYGAGKNNTAAAGGNTAFGYQSLNVNTGIFNTAIGVQALLGNVTGNSNIAIGHQALSTITVGNDNLAIGTGALQKTAGCADEIAIGDSALFTETGGNTQNLAVGTKALFSNTSGSFNTAVGAFSLFANTTGSMNCAVGGGLANSTTGNNNVAVGESSLVTNLSGNFNTAVGVNAMGINATGNSNAALGNFALGTNFSGSNNTAVGAGADVSAENFSNATALGAGAIVDASNKVRIGNSSVTIIEGQVLPTTPSDGRYKFNIREDVKGLDFILRLRPVSYQFDVRSFDARLRPLSEGSRGYAIDAAYEQAMAIRRTGFVAQEVEKAAAACGYDFTGVIRPASEVDHYGLSYEAFIMPMVKAIQEQQAQIDDLKKIVAQQQQMIRDLIQNK